jgi:E3 SUMO-protein ligase PIAS1
LDFVSLHWLCACLCQFFSFQDTGPQLPTNVTAQLKYGTNLLQVMGNFKGNYIIIIAFTGLVVPPEKPVLKDYLQSGVIEASPGN